MILSLIGCKEIAFAFEIPPEMFTDESLRADEVDFDKLKKYLEELKETSK